MGRRPRAKVRRPRGSSQEFWLKLKGQKRVTIVREARNKKMPGNSSDPL
jgi:hypothetical protein